MPCQINAKNNTELLQLQDAPSGSLTEKRLNISVKVKYSHIKSQLDKLCRDSAIFGNFTYTPTVNRNWTIKVRQLGMKDL